MPSDRIEIIPPIHGKLTQDGKVCEPDIYWIVEKWLQRHPEIAGRTNDIKVADIAANAAATGLTRFRLATLPIESSGGVFVEK